MAAARQGLRRTQAERRAGTRAKLLEAALEALVETGYQNLTTPEVCRRAGVSQGALFKHFPTKSALLAAATEHLFAGLVWGYGERFAAFEKGGDPIRPGIALLWNVFQDPRLRAAYDLYTAARTDPELRASLAPVVRDHYDNLHALARNLLRDLVPAPEERLHSVVDLILLAMQGGALGEMTLEQPELRSRMLRLLTELAQFLLVPN